MSDLARPSRNRVDYVRARCRRTTGRCWATPGAGGSSRAPLLLLVENEGIAHRTDLGFDAVQSGVEPPEAAVELLLEAVV